MQSVRVFHQILDDDSHALSRCQSGWLTPLLPLRAVSGFRQLRRRQHLYRLTLCQAVKITVAIACTKETGWTLIQRGLAVLKDCVTGVQVRFLCEGWRGQ